MIKHKNLATWNLSLTMRELRKLVFRGKYTCLIYFQKIRILLIIQLLWSLSLFIALFTKLMFELLQSKIPVWIAFVCRHCSPNCLFVVSWLFLTLPISPFQLPCQILHVLVHYFLVSNYLWMFCEGLYLHTLLVVAFVAEEKLLKWFYLIGWGEYTFPAAEFFKILLLLDGMDDRMRF